MDVFHVIVLGEGIVRARQRDRRSFRRYSNFVCVPTYSRANHLSMLELLIAIFVQRAEFIYSSSTA